MARRPLGAASRELASSVVQRMFMVTTAGLVGGWRLVFESDTARASAVAERVLLQILRRNRGSVYGERHGFASITSADEYRRTVPLIRYEDIVDEIDEMAHQATPNVLTSDPVDYFMLTSGTSGAPKLIPTTKRERSRRISALVFVPQGTVLRQLGPGAVLGRGMNGMSIAATDKYTDAGIPVSSSLRIGLGERTWLLKRLFTSPISAYGVHDVATAYYVHWLFALADRDLRYIADEFASKMAFALSVLVERHEDLAADIARGALGPEIDVEPEVRAEIDAALTTDPARAQEIRAAFAGPDGHRGVVPRVWPSLKYLACITTGTFKVYEPSIRQLCGDLPIFNTTYGLSECSVAVSIGPDDPRYVLHPRASFLEFVPEEQIDEPEPDTKLLHELEEGQRYEIVASNFAGLYRYRTSDIIEVVGTHRRAPIIEFSHRANVLMNFNAEMMTESAALTALQRAAGLVDGQVVDYSIRPGHETFPPHYCFYVELQDAVDSETIAELATKLERALGEENPRYEDRVVMGRLLPCRVRLVAPGGFRDFEGFLGDRAQAKGISAVQTKVPRLMSDVELLAELDRHVLAEAQAEPAAAAVPADPDKGGPA